MRPALQRALHILAQIAAGAGVALFITALCAVFSGCSSELPGLDAGHLCLAPLVPLRTSLCRRLWLRLRACYLRHLIGAAESDIVAMRLALDWARMDIVRLPRQITEHKLWIDAYRLQLADIDLATRDR